MMVTSPGLDELTALLAKRRAEEDAITLELERRRAEVAEDVAALERSIHLLVAEHTVQVPAIPDEPAQASEALTDEGTAHAAEDVQAVHQAPVSAEETETASVSVQEPAGPEAVTVSTVGPSARQRANRAPNWKRELAGLEQPEAIVRIAELCGGTIRVKDAGRIFLEACITRTKPKNINGQIHRLIKESERFERVEPGRYRLRDQEPERSIPSDS
jgi:hypothetical protein